MKKLFTVLALASMMLSTTTVFTSCQQDDPLTEQIANKAKMEKLANKAKAEQQARKDQKEKDQKLKNKKKNTDFKANKYSETANSVVPSQLKK